MMFKVICGVLMGMASSAVWADDISRLQSLAQQEFRALSEDLTGALSYKGVIPAEPLGVTGFDVGVEVTGTKMQNSQIWQKATGSDVATLPIPRLHVHKGLPLNLDIGGFYTSIPGSNIRVFGGELRYSILEGGIATPALSVRGAMSKMTGVDQLDFSTKSVELLVSKGFAMFTPYAGVGQVWSTSTPHVALLKEESFSKGKVFVGGNVSFGLINLAVEADKVGSNNSYSMKLGFRW